MYMKKPLVLIFAFCLPLLSLFSSSKIEEKISEGLINQILSKAPNSIASFDEERLYLKCECLSIKNDRIFLEDLTGYRLELPNLCSNSEGLYVVVGRGQLLVYECTRCLEIYGGHPGVCDRCGGTPFITPE